MKKLSKKLRRAYSACGYSTFGIVLQAVLAVLKLCGAVDWYWIVVLLPVEFAVLYLLCFIWEVWKALRKKSVTNERFKV